MSGQTLEKIETVLGSGDEKPYQKFRMQLKAFKNSGMSYQTVTNNTYNKVHRAGKTSRGLRQIQRGQAKLITETLSNPS